MKRLFSLVALFLLLASSVFLGLPQEKASAQTPNDFSRFCILPVTAGTVSPMFTLKIIDRAHIEVTYAGQGNCTSPASLPADYLDAATSFSTVLNGVYVDGEIDDGRLRYDNPSADGGLLSFIDNFPDNLDDSIQDTFDGRDDKIAISASTFGDTEFTPFFFPRKAGINNICREEDDKLYLGFVTGRNGYEWICDSQTNVQSRGGIRVSIDQSTINNFNITYTYDPANDVIRHVSPNQQGNRTFIWCQAVSEYRARDCNTPQNGMAIKTTKADLDSIGAATREFTIFDINNPSKTMKVEVAGAENSSSTTDEAGGAGLGEGDSCESVADFAFNFVLCPLLFASNELISWVDDRIISALSVDNAYYENEEIKRAWGNIRNVGYILLIPVMLVMVIGTALGFGFLDAYTVKRAMPRLIIAVIFMSLSYEICRIMIEVTNGIGRGIAGIIASPFGGMANLSLDDIFNPGAGSAAVTVGAVGLALAARGVLAKVVIAKLATATVLTLGITLGLAALSLLIIFALLAFREMAIIFLLITSPLAIISWIFPGNDKLWKLWWGSFTKLLYIFPIIMGLIATGRAFASMVGDAGNADPVVGTIIKLVAVVGPYFFIPKAFQMAGGAFANIAGMVNDRSKGIFDRSRKKRAEAKEKAAKDSLSGNRFRGAPEGSLRSSLNKRIQDAAALKEAGYRPSRITAAKRLHGTHELDDVMKDSGAMAVLANDDAANALMSGRGTKEDMIKFLMSSDVNGGAGYDRDNATQIASELQLLARSHGVESLKQAAFVQLAGSKTAFRGGPAEMLNAAFEAAGGDMQTAATLYAKARGAAEQAGRVDLAGYSYGEGLIEAQKMWQARAQGKPEAEVTDLANGVNTRLLNKVVDSKGAGALVSSHGTSVKNLTTIMNDRLTNANANLSDAQAELDRVKAGGGTDEQISIAQEAVYVARDNKAAALAEAANAYDSISYVSPENAREFRDNVLNQQATGYKKVLRAEPVMTTVQRARNDGSGITDTIQVPAMNDDGSQQVRYVEAIVERDGFEPLTAEQMVSVQEAMEANRSNEVFRKTRREHSMTEEEMRRRGVGGTGTGMPGII